MEVFAFVSNVAGLKPGIYRYVQGARIGDHYIERIKEGDRKIELANAALGQGCIKDAALNIVIGAVVQRTAVKYGDREIGTLLVYDINKEYKKGLKEYKDVLDLTRLFFAVLLLLLLGLMVYREYNTKIEQEKRIAEYQAVHDGLTGLFTHKYFKEHLEREISRSQRYKRPVSLVMCDIDFFKRFNDEYGHLAGDEILRTVARIISENVRTSDIVARYGGEEFAILLIETGHKEVQSVAKRLKALLDQSIEVAERIKEKVEHTHIDFENKNVGVTLSMGLSSYDGHEDYDPEALIKEADHALYNSKSSGRNLITVFNPETKELKSFK